MKFGQIGVLGIIGGTDGGPSGPFPAPSGYRWEYVMEGTDPVYEGSERVVELVVIS